MVTVHDPANLGGSNKMLPVADAAALLSVKTRGLRDNWRSWGIPAYKVGRELRFRERDLNAWLAKRAA